MSGDLRRAPKDEENLIAAVAAGWVTALDNLSHMTPDLSDAMCCIVTGAESVKRALFTDGDVSRVGYRRPLLLTGIDVGVIRPDLAERLLPLRLERPRVRRTEAELWAEYAEVLPVVLGSLLDLTVKVRAVEAETPTDLRMADFAHLCAQLDAATGLGALTAYRASLDDLNDDVIEGDLLAQTVLRHADTIEPGAAQRMTSTEWLHCLSRFYSGDEPRPLPKGWPTTGKVLSDRLKRLQPTLAARGVLIDTGHNSEGRYLDRPPVLRQRQMVRGRGRLPCDPGRRTHRPVHPAADDHPPALDQRPTRFQRPRLSRRGLVQPPSGEAGRVPALRQERHRHGEVQGRRPGDLRRSRPREPIDLHQEGTRQHGPPHHLFAQGVVAVETLRSDLEVRTKFLDQVAAHTPDHRLLDDFGTLRVVFGILLKGGQDIRVDSLLAFAQVSLLQAVRRLRAMNAEVEVVAIRR